MVTVIGDYFYKKEMVLFDFDVTILINGKEHSGKTSLVAYLDSVLKEAGCNVTLQRIDEKLDSKLENTDKSKKRIENLKVFICEMTTQF